MMAESAPLFRKRESMISSIFASKAAAASSSLLKKQLVLCDCEINHGDSVFLDIGNHHPVSLLGGFYHSVAIGSEGEVIFINRNSVKYSSKSPIAAVSLPDGLKASSVACRLSLHIRHRIKRSPQFFYCFQTFKSRYCLFVNKKGNVFVRGPNYRGQLGLGKGKESVSAFTEICSLEKYEIMNPTLNASFHFLKPEKGTTLMNSFRTVSQSEMTLLICQQKRRSLVMLVSALQATVSVFIGSGPPPNTPNMRILQYQ